jgi:protein-S-isoprenylcysteine O-methyltransferase Ste14
VLFLHPATLGLLTYVFVVLNATAAGEEKRLAASEFGPAYAEYMKKTGRFLPRPWGAGA